MKNKKLSALSLGAVLAVTLLTSEHAFSQELSSPNSVPNQGHMPYRQLNVGQNYLNDLQDSYTTSAPLINLLPYLPNPSGTDKHAAPEFKLDGQGGIYSYLSVNPSTNPSKPAPQSVILVMKNVTESGYSALKNSGTCTTTGTINPDSLICKVKVTNGKSGQSSVLPVIVYNGLRANTVEKMISNRIDYQNYQVISSQPYLLRVSGTTKDFADSVLKLKSGDSQQFLSQYFHIPTAAEGQITYSLDGSYLSNDYSGTSQAPSGGSSYCGVRYISPLTSNNHWATSCVSSKKVQGKPAIYINTVNGESGLFVQNLKPGVYQVNLRADWKAHKETAFQTFYIAVYPSSGGQSNQTFSAWQNGAVPSMNMFGAKGFNSIYAYTGSDPVASPVQFKQTLTDFASDISELNNNQSTYLRQPIKTVLLQIATMAFTGSPSSTMMHLAGTSGGGGNPNTQIGGGFWPLSSLGSSNPYNQISHGQLKSSRPNLSKWFNSTVGDPLATIKGHGAPVRATVLYTFDGPLKSDFNTLNAKQRAILADWIVNQMTSSGDIAGTGFDLEGSFTQPPSVAFYKYLTDKLAYNGRWMSYFAFSDFMTPSTVASLGPLGVTGISTYDVGSYRAPQNATTAKLLPATIPYVDSGFTTDEAQTLFGNSDAASGTAPSNAPFGYQVVNGAPMSNDILCTVFKNGDTQLILPVSGCNLSLNDSYSENNRLFKEVYKDISPYDAVKYFGGTYQPTLPVAASGTEWNAAQIWHPNFNFTRGTTANDGALQGGNILRGTAAKPGDPCYGVNTAFLADITVPPKGSTGSAGYQKLEKCLFANVKIGGKPVQSISNCGINPKTNQPYLLSQCIQVSGLASTSKAAGINSVTYPTQTGYDKTNLMVYADTYAEHSAGFSLFALETAAVTKQHGDYNPTGTLNMVVTEPYAVGMHEPTANAIDPYYNLEDVQNEWKNFGKMYTDFFHEYGPKASD